MTLEESKISLKTNGYCDFDLKEFSPEYYNLLEKIKYKTEDTKYLENFKVIRFDYHNEEDNIHINHREIFENFDTANLKKEELLKEYDYEHTAQMWLISESTPMHTIDEKFENLFYDILEYFYNETEDDVRMGQQWTCYSEKCFLKDHNDGQGDEYQNTCAILIYLNEEWDESWGGNLILRNTRHTNDGVVAHKVVPTFAKVAIIDLKTFDTSHAVEDIIGDHNRCTILSFATSKTPRIKLDSTIL
jgi:Rps23 Pro-64 3,4-dihydroxylase Tpa1-like proline 4-hydroxylase